MKGTNRRANVAVIGTGRIGTIHARNLSHYIPEAFVSAVSDTDRASAERCAAELGIERALEDHRLILDDPRIEAVIICTATDTHASMIEESAAAGKHIFCEKPIALDLPSIDKSLAAVERAGAKLQVGFQRRFDPSFRRARNLIADGKIGQPHLLRITSRDPQPPPPEYIKVSGGIFLDMTIHDFDMARFLFRDEVEEIHAFGSVLVDPKIARLGDLDTAITTLRFRSGALGAIDNSRRSACGYDQRVEVLGSHGMIAVDNRTTDSTVIGNEEGMQGPPPLHFFIERYSEAYLEEMKAFIKAVSTDQEPEVTGWDGRVPVEMAHAAKRSYAEGRPIKMTSELREENRV